MRVKSSIFLCVMLLLVVLVSSFVYGLGKKAFFYSPGDGKYQHMQGAESCCRRNTRRGVVVKRPQGEKEGKLHTEENIKARIDK